MRVFIIGATGAVGPYVVRALIESGHEVTALVRSNEKAGQVTRLGARAVFGSLYDTSALARVFAGHDAVLNLATSIPNSLTFALPSAWRDNARIRSEGTQSVADAAITAGVPRVVQESIAFAYPDQGDDWIDETTPLDPFSIVTTTPISEAHIERFTHAGGVGVVLRFGAFYGPGSAQSKEMLLAAKLRLGMVLGRADSYWSPIHLADAADAVVAALQASPGVYNVVDDVPVTKRAWADAISQAVGRRAWLHGPGRLAGLPGEHMGAITRSLRVSNAKFKEETGWTPRFPSAREGWQSAVHDMHVDMRGLCARVLAGVLVLLTLGAGAWATFSLRSW